MKPITTPQVSDFAPFTFQQLDVYIAARELAQCLHQANIGDAELRDQATRAAKSTFLNIAEGLPDASPGVRRRHFTIARNSLCEAAAAIDLAVVLGVLAPEKGAALGAPMRRLGSLVGGLLRR